MAEDDGFITHLMGFGLTRKEAECYLSLLKYGPKTPSRLAKSLKTYREDVHRTLAALIDKGMVRPSLDSPTLYAAVELETALQSAIKKHETELLQMEQRKRELEELARQQWFRPSDEVSTFKILKSLKEVLTIALSTLASVEKEWLAVVPPIATVISAMFVIEAVKEFTGRGGKIRYVTDITYPHIESIREDLEAGAEVRHFDTYSGVMFFVFDGKISMNAINIADLKRVSLSEPVSVLWTDDPAYAQYLASTFELLWQQSIPAEHRIQELLEQRPPQV